MRFSWFGDYNASNDQDLGSASALMRSAEETLIHDYPVIPIYFFVSKHMVDESIGGFETNVVDRHPSQFLRRLNSAN